MDSIFGWIDQTVDDGAAKALLERIESNRRAVRGRRTASVRLADTTVGVEASLLPADVARNDGTVAAVLGHFLWPDPALDKLAAERGPAAAMLAAYERYGDEVPKRLRGSFAFVLVDVRRRAALLATDRLGIRSMCFALVPGGAAFGSTVDHVLRHPAVRQEISHQAVFDYLYCQIVPSPETIFAGVQKLLPAERVLIRDGKVERDLYWQLPYGAAGTRRSDDLTQEFRRLVRDATARAIDGTAPDRIGAFLSGGTDSSTVTGMLTEITGRKADTYSIGFEADGFDEMSYARIAARHFASNPHEYYVSPRDVVDAIPRIAEAYDEPFGNASAVPTYHCARLASEDGKSVLLAGDGGDEVFGGNARYAKQKVFEWYGMVPQALRRGLIEPLLLAHPAERIAPLRKLQSYIRQARIPLPERLETYNALERGALEAIFEPEFLRTVNPRGPTELAREAYFRARSHSPIDRMMHLDLKQTLADNDLRKVDRMCALAGIEVRYPLLDEALVEFSGRLSPDQKVRGLELRHFFKEALRDFLPPETIAKTKHGFGLPFGLWMRDHPMLHDLAHASLQAFARRGWMRTDFIEGLLKAHRDDHATYYGAMIWVVLMLEHWLTLRRR